MSEKIRKDLEARIEERLQEWLHDAVQLYEIAEIPISVAMLDISGQLMMQLTRVLACSEATPEDIGIAVGEAIKNAVAWKREDTKRQQTQS